MFVYFVETSKRILKHILKLFSSSGSHTILVFQTLWQYSNRTPNLGKNCDFDQYLSVALITAGPLRVIDILTLEYKL